MKARIAKSSSFIGKIESKMQSATVIIFGIIENEASAMEQSPMLADQHLYKIDIAKMIVARIANNLTLDNRVFE